MKVSQGMRFVNILLIFLLSFLIGCEKFPQKVTDPVVASGNSASNFKQFYVYKDSGESVNHFIPSGFMPNAKCLKFDDNWKDGCYQGTSCIRISFDVNCSKSDQKWSGVYWLNPANNWGKQKGGFNLYNAEKLTFWAKGEKGGERIEEFRIGGISGDFPDSDTAVIGPVILTNEWRQYTIDLRGKDLSYIAGGFSWSTSANANAGNCLFYLDEIQYQ